MRSNVDEIITPQGAEEDYISKINSGDWFEITLVVYNNKIT